MVLHLDGNIFCFLPAIPNQGGMIKDLIIRSYFSTQMRCQTFATTLVIVIRLSLTTQAYPKYSFSQPVIY